MDERIPPRRIILRGALALACGACLPLAPAGCDAKKGTDSGSSAPGTAPAGTPGSAAPATSRKVSQASVQYQPRPNGGLKCQDCTHFIAASNTCELVEGQISPDGWCRMWAKKV